MTPALHAPPGALTGCPRAERVAAATDLTDALAHLLAAERALREAHDWLGNESAAADCCVDAVKAIGDASSDARCALDLLGEREDRMSMDPHQDALDYAAKNHLGSALLSLHLLKGFLEQGARIDYSEDKWPEEGPRLMKIVGDMLLGDMVDRGVIEAAAVLRRAWLAAQKVAA